MRLLLPTGGGSVLVVVTDHWTDVLLRSFPVWPRHLRPSHGASVHADLEVEKDRAGWEYLPVQLIDRLRRYAEKTQLDVDATFGMLTWSTLDGGDDEEDDDDDE